MTTKYTGGPAFPRSGVKDGYGKIVGDVKGMTLRDWFAGQALAGLLANTNDDFNEPPSKWAYAIADAMLADRSN
jgi:hypothetical protein